MAGCFYYSFVIVGSLQIFGMLYNAGAHGLVALLASALFIYLGTVVAKLGRTSPQPRFEPPASPGHVDQRPSGPIQFTPGVSQSRGHTTGTQGIVPSLKHSKVVATTQPTVMGGIMRPLAGQYTEKLPFGTGELRVSLSGWYLYFYFPGPDLRYNGESKRIEAYDIDGYIEACRDSWNEFLSIRDHVPTGGEFSKSGRKGMRIQVGSYREGIFVFGYHLHIGSKEKMLSFVQSLHWAKTRAKQVQDLLEGF